jgi:hypothetical protein
MHCPIHPTIDVPDDGVCAACERHGLLPVGICHSCREPVIRLDELGNGGRRDVCLPCYALEPEEQEIEV